MDNNTHIKEEYLTDNNPRIKKEYLTVLSVFSAFAVVMLHVNSRFWSFSYSPEWICANVIECIFYFAVPIFFMISGATLIDYNEHYNTKTYFIKRIKKSFIPYIIWSMLGLLYLVVCNGLNISELGIGWVISSLFNGNIISIYWFFIPLFAMYLIIPFLSKIPKENREKTFRYIIICIFILDIMLPFIFNILQLNYGGALKVGIGYVIYILLGYYIDNYTIPKKIRIAIYILGIASLFVHFFGTWGLSYATGNIEQTFKGYLNFPCLLYSVAIFMFFKYKNQSKFMHTTYRFASGIQSTTLGIYLMHIYLIWLIDFLLPYNIIYRLPIGILVFAVAALITYVLQKIPVVNKIVPK